MFQRILSKITAKNKVTVWLDYFFFLDSFHFSQKKNLDTGTSLIFTTGNTTDPQTSNLMIKHFFEHVLAISVDHHLW